MATDSDCAEGRYTPEGNANKKRDWDSKGHGLSCMRQDVQTSTGVWQDGEAGHSVWLADQSMWCSCTDEETTEREEEAEEEEMKEESIVIRHCERCDKATRQRVEWLSWFEVRTECLESIGDDGEQCREFHIFTLSHLRSYWEGRRPFSRVDLGITVKEEK